jgi:dTDP-6-deoxy-L-talose 4-dehydrogenase [NAD(P)+]
MADTVVLGGTGFLGRHVCALLADRGRQVLAIARHATDPPPGARLATLDPVSAGPDALPALLRAERATVVVNAAGGVWDVDEEQMVASNVTLVEYLVDAVTRAPGRPRLVHLGSAHEYGAVPYGSLVSERTPPAPATPYGRTKLRGTDTVLRAAARGHADAVVLRVSNVLGPGAPASSLLGAASRDLRAAVATGRPAVLQVTSGQAHRDFVDVRDVADAVARAADGSAAGVFNVGGGVAVGIRAVLRRLVDISGAPADIVVEPVGGAGPVRNAGDWQQLDIEAARRHLGWTPRRRLDESLRALWETTVAPAPSP